MCQYHSRQFKLLEISQYTTELCVCKPRQLCEDCSVCLEIKTRGPTQLKKQYSHNDGRIQALVARRVGWRNRVGVWGEVCVLCRVRSEPTPVFTRSGLRSSLSDRFTCFRLAIVKGTYRNTELASPHYYVTSYSPQDTIVRWHDSFSIRQLTLSFCHSPIPQSHPHIDDPCSIQPAIRSIRLQPFLNSFQASTIRLFGEPHDRL